MLKISGLGRESVDLIPEFIELATLVSLARQSKGMSQRQLSRTLNKSPGYMGHLERGDIRPTVDTLKDISASLGILYNELAVAAGYLSRDEVEFPINGQELLRLKEINDLSEREWESVKDFAHYIRSKRHG